MHSKKKKEAATENLTVVRNKGKPSCKTIESMDLPPEQTHYKTVARYS
jgi:hypothetical protein